MTRRLGVRVVLAAAGVLALGSCGGGVGAGDLVAQATGTWECSVQLGEDTNDVTVEVDPDGAFTLTAGDDQVDGTWQRDGDEVTITTDQPFFFNELTYQGATDEPEQLTVVEDEGITGVFDVDIDGDQVTFTQAEYADGEAADPDFPVVYTCTKQ